MTESLKGNLPIGNSPEMTTEGKLLDYVFDRKTITVGSRKSDLAVIQTKTIMTALKERSPDVNLAMELMDTLGDKILHIALPKIGEKSLFTKDLENALADGRVDFLVHSLKDLPTRLPDQMVITTIYERDDPHDCILFHPKHRGKTLAQLPVGSVIGTSSLRRVAQLKRKYGHLQFQSVRGNLNTRLRKLEQDAKYDAIVLAKAGIDRMGWTQKIGQVLTEDECLYAIGQGAMTVEIRRDDQYMIKLLASLSHTKTLLACAAERSFMRALNGGCSTPVGCYSRFHGDKFSLRGVVLDEDGSTCLDLSVHVMLLTHIFNEDPPSYVISKSGIVVNSLFQDELMKAESCGEQLAVRLKDLGADEILAGVRSRLPKVSTIQEPSTSDNMKF